MNKNILALVFLMAGTLLTTVVTTMVRAAYADNKNKAEDDSAAAIADCDDNEVEEAGFDCEAIALNDIEIEEEEGGDMVLLAGDLGFANGKFVEYD